MVYIFGFTPISYVRSNVDKYVPWNQNERLFFIKINNKTKFQF